MTLFTARGLTRKLEQEKNLLVWSCRAGLAASKLGKRWQNSRTPNPMTATLSGFLVMAVVVVSC